MTPHCPTCRHIMHRADGELMCRRNGILATPANAEDCWMYEREPGSDDKRMVWFEGAWVVNETEGL